MRDEMRQTRISRRSKLDDIVRTTILLREPRAVMIEKMQTRCLGADGHDVVDGNARPAGNTEDDRSSIGKRAVDVAFCTDELHGRNLDFSPEGIVGCFRHQVKIFRANSERCNARRKQRRGG